MVAATSVISDLCVVAFPILYHNNYINHMMMDQVMMPPFIPSLIIITRTVFSKLTQVTVLYCVHSAGVSLNESTGGKIVADDCHLMLRHAR